MSIVVFLMLPILGLIFYQDIMFRKVSVILFPPFFLLTLIFSLQTQNVETIAVKSLINSLYLLLVVGVSYFYFYIRHGIRKISGILGAGDLLFLFCIISLFDLPQFVLFTTVSFLASLGIHLLMRGVFAFYRIQTTVPLAGYLSLCLGARILIGVSGENMMIL